MAIIRADERVFISGKTGCGKTYLAQKFLPKFPYVVVLDNKGMFTTNKDPTVFEWKGTRDAILVRDLDDLPKATEVSGHIVYRPDPVIESNRSEFRDLMDSFFWWVYYRENTVLYIDEATAVTDSFYIPPGLNAIYKRGREKNIGAWASSQQPVFVHNTLISEAEHYFLFRTQLQSHRNKLAGFMGEVVKNKIPGSCKYNFYYYNPESMDEAVFMEPIK